MRLIAIISIMFTSIFVSSKALATSCLAVFPEIAGSHSSTGFIYFESDAVLFGTDTILDIGIGQDLSSRSCDNNTACTSSGDNTASLQLPTFSYTTSSVDITVAMNTTQNATQGEYDYLEIDQNSILTMTDNNIESRFDHVFIKNNSDWILEGGVYWIDTLEMEANTEIIISGSDKVTIYVNNFILGDNVRFNYNGSEEQLVLVGYGDMATGTTTLMRGFLYVVNDLDWDDYSKLYGAMNAKFIRIGVSGTFYTRLADISLANFNNMCDESSTLPEPIAYYSMDMCVLSTGNGTIEDKAGINDADSHDGTTPDFSGYHCQAAKFDGDDAYIDVPDSVFEGLSEGSISFYFNTSDMTHSSSASKGSMALISRDESGTDSVGHLSLWVTDSGGIIARQQNANTSVEQSTSASNFQENQWHHVVHTWGPDGLRTYTDGVLRLSYSGFTDGLDHNGPDMAVAGNAWQWQSISSDPRASQLKDYFKGSIDELRIYDEQLSASQVLEVADLSSQTCASCTTPVELIAHWGADVCSFASNQLVDVVNGNDATIQNGISLSSASRFCQGLVFDGNESYATVLHDEVFEIANGAISLWFKLSDLTHSNNAYAGGNALISKDTVNYGTDGHLDIRVDSNARIQVRHQTGGSSYYFNTDPIVQENTWHHLVYSFGSQGVKIYIDGNLLESDGSFTEGWDDNVEILAFGATSRTSSLTGTSSSNFKDFMLGEMDNIKIYKNQPSDGDVASWFQEATGACSTCSSLLGEYKFDQDNPDATTVEDTSGYNNDGVLGSQLLNSLINNNVSCRALETSTATGNEADYYFDTGIEGEDIGNQGSVSFWFNSKSQWNDGYDRQLFDATNTDNNKYLFLVKQDDGSIRFGIETDDDNDLIIDTSSQTTAADTWVHITVTWNLVAKEYNIYFDGVAQSLSFLNDELVNATMADLGTLVFGDNRTDYRVNGSSSLPANAYFDDIRVYSQVISSAQISADMAAAESCALVDHYLIEHPTTALTCDSPQIIVKACANEECDTLATTSSTVSLSPNIFETSNSATFIGQTTFTLNNRDTGTFTLSSASQDPAAPVKCDSGDCEITYEGIGVQFFNTLTDETHFNNSVFIAQDNLSTVGLRIVGSNGGGSCDSVVSDTQDIALTYQCVQTNAVDYTPTSCNVPFAGIPLSGNVSQSGTINFSFDANGDTNFAAYNFADAGILRLTASATVDGASVLAANTDLKIVPANLVIDTNSATVNTAGEEFSVSVKAIGSAGDTLPGYQANDLKISAQRNIPSSVNAVDAQFHVDDDDVVTTSLAASFNSVNMNFVNGVASSSTAYMEEVGTYTIDVQDSNYLGASIEATALSLGRFIPAYFDVEAVHQPLLENTCSNFTNVGESFGFVSGLEPSIEVTAYNAKGRVTANYTGDLWKLAPSAASMSGQVTRIDNAVYSLSIEQLSELSNVSITGADLYDGKATITALGYTYQYAKVATPSGNDASPFTTDMDLSLSSAWFTDSDNVCFQESYPGSCASFSFDSITGANLRYTRLNLANTFGPENEALSLPVYTEYLDAGQWRVNENDICTSLNLQQSAGDINIIHDAQSTNNIADLVSSTTLNSVMMNGVLPASDTVFGPYAINGESALGSFYIELVPKNQSNYWSNYLNYDWDGDGDIDLDDKPAASINFGVYRGNERTLHWREVLN